MKLRVPPSRIRRYRLLAPLGSTRNSVVYTTMVPGTCEKQAIKLIHHSVMPMSRIDNEYLIQGFSSIPTSCR
jgi:hypothetical protein